MLTTYAEAGTVHWPSLVAACERRGLPVLRVDQRGDAHIIRSVD